jgi:SAM-dependent methyltransferase
VAETLPTGSRLLDIGAGTTPLAPYLTTLGYVVDTVDPSTQVRGWPPRDDWNEWGYLDYGRARLAHRSWNTTLDRLPPLPLFDGLVSVSVIEHVPGDVRRALLHEFAHRVRDGGLVVLTVDLVRGSDDLWNRNLGVEVEDPSDHGTLQEMIDEAGRAGLEPVDTQTIRYWGTGDIDIALIVLRRGDRPGGQRAGRGRRGMRGLARRLRTGRTT